MVVSLPFNKVLRLVKFPVYGLNTDEVYLRDGLLLANELVIDDTNQPGDTLGKRRLLTPHKKKPLTKTYTEFIDLVKENPAFLVDNNGKPFKYQKTVSQVVKSFRIKKRELKDTYTRIWLQDVNFAVIIREPAYEMQWAQMLCLNNNPWLLYSLSEEKMKDFRKKI